MEEKIIDIVDIIIKKVDNVMGKTEYGSRTIRTELGRVERYKRVLNNKMMKIGESLVNKNVKVPRKFKKISEVIDSENIRSFYFDLFFYGFADYEEDFGILVEDSRNFYLKITSTINERTQDITFQEELYATEEIIQQVINYERDTLKNCP